MSRRPAREAPDLEDTLPTSSRRPRLELDALRELSAACSYRVKELAIRLGISPRQLRRRFRQELQCPPERWLLEERLRRAGSMLLAADSVKEVAFALGFRHESQFCREFRARYGCTPSVWKRRGAKPDDM